MKFELHAHTSQSSHCGRVPAAEGVAAYKRAGYSGVVITDHFEPTNVECFPGTPIERAKTWLGGYEASKAAGDLLGIAVLFGLEARLPDYTGDNDYLIFGVEPSFVLENPELYRLDLPGLHELCKAHGALLIQAHPNRLACCSPADTRYLDGLEVFNGNPRQDNHNDLTRAMANAEPRLIRTSGSDFHRPEDLARGGIDTGRSIRTSKDIAECLRSGDYTIIESED